MLNFEEELEKFQPSMDIEKVEDVVYHNNLADVTDIVKELKAGDYVYLTGTIYTARDAAHKRMYEALKNGEALPFDIEGNVIYYNGSILFCKYECFC